MPPQAVFFLDSGGEFKLELIDIENLEFYTVTSSWHVDREIDRSEGTLG